MKDLQPSLQKLKEVIWNANPSILDLKFGCEVANEFGGIFTIWQKIEKHHLGGGFYRTGFGEYPLDKVEQMRILGRQITLADCIYAMRTNVRMDGIVLMMNIKGTMAYSDAQNSLLRRWNLKDDNLDHQSPECQQFLIDLLT